MPKALTATELRSQIYRVLDEVLEKGIPQEVKRGGRSVLILPKEGRRLRLRDLPRRKALNCSPDELVATSWDEAWDGHE